MAKKIRKQEIARARQQARRKQLFVIIGLGALGVLAVVAITVSVLSSTAPSAAAGSQVVGSTSVCSAVQSPPDEGRNHLQPGETPTYLSQPPSSGTHNNTPLPAGVYDYPVDVTMEVHSLEHGYIVIHYNGITSSQINDLKQLVERDPRKLILSPYPNMTDKVSLTAWDHLQTCTGVDSQVVLNFIGNYRDRGPENVP